MKAYILSFKDGKVQIGNKIFHLTSGEIEPSQANRQNLTKDCECFVEVPFKSMAGAQLAYSLATRRTKKGPEKR